MTDLNKAWDKVIAMRAEQGRKLARMRLTELMCAGYRMKDALDKMASENVTLGIHGREIAEEERGYVLD